MPCKLAITPPPNGVLTAPRAWPERQALRQGEALPDSVFQRFESELNAVIASIAQGFRIE